MGAKDSQAFIMLNSSNNVKQPQYLQPLTSIVNNKTQTKHKISDSILPVCNRPMIHYVLDWCEQAFFTEVNLVIYDEHSLIMSLSFLNYQTSLLVLTMRTVLRILRTVTKLPSLSKLFSLLLISDGKCTKPLWRTMPWRLMIATHITSLLIRIL